MPKILDLKFAKKPIIPIDDAVRQRLDETGHQGLDFKILKETTLMNRAVKVEVELLGSGASSKS